MGMNPVSYKRNMKGLDFLTQCVILFATSLKMNRVRIFEKKIIHGNNFHFAMGISLGLD